MRLTIRLCGLVFAFALFCSAQGAQAQEDRWWKWWFGDPEEEQWWYRWLGDPRIDGDQVEEDQQTLREAKIGTGSHELLEYLRSLAPSAEDERAIIEQVKLLDSKKFAERESASNALKKAGPKAIPVLRQQLHGAVLEVRRRLESCLKELEEKSPAPLKASAVRLLRARKPAGAVAALMEFAAYAADESVEEEIADAIFLLGYRGGKIDPVLETALKDKIALRRGIAAMVVGRYGTLEQRQQVKSLLGDKDADVRVRAAQGIVGGGDPAGVPELLEMLKSGTYAQAERAEDLLLQIAQATAPKQPLLSNRAEREKCYAAWKQWDETERQKLVMIVVDPGVGMGSAELRAKKLVKDFVDVAFGGAKKKGSLLRLVDVPFYTPPGRVLHSFQELEDDLAKEGQMPEGLKFTVTTKNVIRTGEYLGRDKIAESEKEFLVAHGKGEVRVAMVALAIEFMGMRQEITLPFFIRMTGARTRLVGVGTPTDVNIKQ
jgi:HEAT repeat protein